MVGEGTVVASIFADGRTDAAGNGNSISTSSDNTVYFDNVWPSVTINRAVGQSNPTDDSSVTFDVKFSEAVTGFDAVRRDPGRQHGRWHPFHSSNRLAGHVYGYRLRHDNERIRGRQPFWPEAQSTPPAMQISPRRAPTMRSSSEARADLGFRRPSYTTNEDAGTVTITVTRAGHTDGAVSIDYYTDDSTAHDGSDYLAVSGTLSWADGEGGDKTFTISILPDDLNEGRELINLVLTNPTGNPLLGTTTATVAIAPSDGQGPGSTTTTRTATNTRSNSLGKTGSLLYYRTDPDGDGKGPIELIELSGTLPDPLKPKAGLVITVAKSKSSTDGGTIGLGAITGTGLKYISARKANLNGDGIDLNGYLGSLVIGSINNGADITTQATTNPKQKTRINALAIGDGSAIEVGANVSSLVATSFGASSFHAPSVGVFKVKGVVMGADIEVAGNVGAVVVGAFRDSKLFAGYIGPDIPDPAGFNFPATVTTFRCTDKTDGFQNSRVIASVFKTVTIASLDSTNPANKFGFYADTSFGSIKIVGQTKFKYNPALPTPQGIDDFEIKIV